MDSSPVPTIASLLGASASCTPHTLLDELRSSPALAIGERCMREIVRNNLFLDSARLEARALARISYRALVDLGPADLDKWLAEQVEHAALELITEDMLLHETPQHALTSRDPARAIGECLGLESRLATRACAELNLLPADLRMACRRLFLDAAPFSACAEELGLTPAELRERIETVLINIHRITAQEGAARIRAEAT